MKIYFACSISGGRQDQKIYEELVDHIQSLGHEVVNAVISRSNITVNDGKREARDVYARDTSWIEECDVVIAEVSTPSHGVGFEIGYSLELSKPVLCCYMADRVVSKMILGNPHKDLVIYKYQDVAEIKEIINRFLT